MPNRSRFAPKMRHAMKVRCGTCRAPRGKPCVRLMGARKGEPLDVPHYERTKHADEAQRLVKCPRCHGSGKVVA